MENSDSLKIAISQKLIEDVFLTILKEEKKNPVFKKDELILHFLTAAVGSLVYTRLMEKPKGKKAKSEEEVYEFTRDNFNRVKQDIQEAVGLAFSGSTTVFSGKTTEYYCQVKIVPEPVSKLPC